MVSAANEAQQAIVVDIAQFAGWHAQGCTHARGEDATGKRELQRLAHTEVGS